MFGYWLVFGDIHVYHSFVHKSLIQRTKIKCKKKLFNSYHNSKICSLPSSLENVERHINCTMILSYTIFVYVAKELHAFKFQCQEEQGNNTYG